MLLESDSKVGCATQAAQDGMDDSPRRLEKQPLFEPPPSIEDVTVALQDLCKLLHPRRKSWLGYLRFVGDDQLQSCMEQMKMLLGHYTQLESSAFGSWIAASLQTAVAWEFGPHQAKWLCKWTHSFLEDRHALPFSPMGEWTKSLLEKPDLKDALCEHLQTVGKYICTMDIVEFMSNPKVLLRYGLKKLISLSTAQVWMHTLDYHWTKMPSGQYINGHEWADVVDYHNTVFLPVLAALDPYVQQFIDGAFIQGPILPDGLYLYTQDWINGIEAQGPLLRDGSFHLTGDVQISLSDDSPIRGVVLTVVLPGDSPGHPTWRQVVFWYHDKSMFYANDHHQVYWVKKGEKAQPRAKGEGASLMVADFVSANYGWLRSPDGTESA